MFLPGLLSCMSILLRGRQGAHLFGIKLLLGSLHERPSDETARKLTGPSLSVFSTRRSAAFYEIKERFVDVFGSGYVLVGRLLAKIPRC